MPGQAIGPHAVASSRHPVHQSFWLWVMCLTGVDYFSTLGYQPSIAFEATGLLTPLATVVLVLVTLFGALPVYAHVAAESPHGQGSIAMLERLLRGWTGKIIVLSLLGFATTDFVITKTLSAGDAAKHVIENPIWRDVTQHVRGWGNNAAWQGLAEFFLGQIGLTMLMLVILGAMFLRGFREVIGLAVVLVGVYLLLNAIIILSGFYHLATHPQVLQAWLDDLATGNWQLEHRPLQGWLPGNDSLTMIALCVLLFPQLALGLSGFETGVAVMPLIKGEPGDDRDRPRGRIRNARKLLLTAALIMCAYLLGAAVVTSTLIPPGELQRHANAQGEVVKGKAVERALAYLAHSEGPHAINPLFGEAFGTLYDISTVLILWFAGASAMAGLLNLVPQYLPRYGMAPEWAKATRPLVLLFTFINLIVTYLFKADPTAQGGAYATGVLVLISSACVATFIHFWRKPSAGLVGRLGRLSGLAYFGIVTAVFLYTTVDVVISKIDGLLIGGCFILAILLASVVSRTLRVTELRFMGFQFVDEQSRFLWDSMKFIEFPALVPHRPGSRALADKEKSIREEHHLSPEIPIVFIEAELGDVSEFYQSPLMEVKQEEGRFIIRVTRCNSIAHVIAAIGLELSKVGKPPEIHFGWSDENPLAASISFVLFGEGNIPWMVRQLILKAEPDPARQPRVIVG